MTKPLMIGARCALAAVLILVLAGIGPLPAVAAAAEPVERPMTVAPAPAPGAEMPPPRVERPSSRRAGTGIFERSATAVRSAFRDVVAEPNRSTVRVLCGGKPAALGTVVDADGLILTKSSELKTPIACRLPGGQTLPAEIVATRPDYDLALLRVKASGLSPVTWREDSPAVGSFLATPGEGELPAAIGVVSVAPRRIPPTGGFLGVMLDSQKNDPRVNQVVPDSAAAAAGLMVDDVIKRINDLAVATGDAVIDQIRRFNPGDQVRLKIQRGETEVDLVATLGGPPQDAQAQRRDFQNHLGGELSARRAGFPQAIQHDTFLAPADCGGPLVDLDGRAVGVNIARAGRVNSYAIPADKVREVLADLKAVAQASAQAAPGDKPRD